MVTPRRSPLEPVKELPNEMPNEPKNQASNESPGQPPTESPSGSPADPITADDQPPVHVVLYHPEIPPNTGNIGRTCVALGARLWLVRPLGFEITDAQIRRSGLDYWQHLDLHVVDDWQQLLRRLPDNPRMWFCSRFARRTPWSVDLRRGDVFVFGSESSGLPNWILDPSDPQSLNLPTDPKVRSLNLATTAGVFLYEHHRQITTG